jgi:hypothetical protein
MAVNTTPDRVAAAQQALIEAQQELAAAKAAAKTPMRKTRVEYGLCIRMPRIAVIAAIKAGWRGAFYALGPKTDENLIWNSEFPASDGWHQRSAMSEGDRAVIMIVTNDND